MAAGRIPLDGFEPVIDASGNAIAGATLHVYLNGTTTTAPIFQDPAMTVAATNPQTSTAAGYFRAQTTALYADAFQTYTLRLTYPSGTIVTRDNVSLIDAATATGISDFSADLLPLTDAEEWRDALEIPEQFTALRRETVTPQLPDLTPPIPAFYMQWGADQFIASGTATVLVPHIPRGVGDEGYQSFRGNGVVATFDAINGLDPAHVVAYNDSGGSVTISGSTTTPAAPTITFAATPADGAYIHVWRRAGRFRVTNRAAGVKITVQLRHGAIIAADSIITVTAYVNGTAVTTAPLSREEAPAGDIVTTGTIILPSVRGLTPDVIYLEMNQSNGSGSVLGILAGSRIVVEPLAVTAIPTGVGVAGIHQGAQLTDADIPALSQMDLMCVSGMWTGQIAASGDIAHGQVFFDGFVSTAWPGLSNRLNAARANRAAIARPGCPRYLAYMTATVAAPSGTLAGQARYSRYASKYANLTAGQTAFVAPADVTFQPFGGQFSSSGWCQIITAAGQFQLGYGQLYDQVSPGVYELTTTVGSLEATLRWSGSGNRDLTLTLSTPLTALDYVGVATFVPRSILSGSVPWTITPQGRANVRDMVSRTFGDPNFTTAMDGIFLDLCAPAFIAPDDLEEVLKILRPFAPPGHLMANMTIPDPVNFLGVACRPSFMAGDIVMIEGAGSKVGVDSITDTLKVVAARDKLAAEGKDVKLAWLATIAQDVAGPVTSNAAIIAARNAFNANSRDGDLFMCHWSGLGTPYNTQARPLPLRMPGVLSWDGTL